MQTDEKQINIYECIPASLIEAHKGIICKITSFEHLAGNNNINFEIMPSGGFSFRKESGYTTHQSIGKDLITKKEVDEAIKKLLKSYNDTIYKLKDYDKRVPSQFFPLNYLKNISIELIDKKDKSPVYWSCIYKFEVPAYEISVKNDKKEERLETIKCIINNVDLQIDVNKKGMIIGMQYNLLPFEFKKKLPMYNILTPDKKLPQVNYLINSQTCSITPFFISTGETAYVPACKESILPKDIEKPKSNTDAFGVYYMLEPYCIRVGQVGKNTDVRLINEGVEYEYAKKKIDEANNVLKIVDLKSEEGKMALEIINTFSKKNSTSVGMKEEELNMRAFMTVVRIGEASSKTKISDMPLDYNILGGGSTFDSYSKHPGVNEDDVAGAYQFKLKTWKDINRVEKQSSFSPQSQDRAFIINVQIQDKDNPRAKGVLKDIYSGNFSSFAVKLNGTWTSLPESGSESKMTIKQGENLFKVAISNELKGFTYILTTQGKLNLKIVYKNK